MSTALAQRSVSFYGDDLIVVRQGETSYTPVKPVCDLLGIDWESQRRRIQDDDVLADAAQTITVQVHGADQARPMLCLPLDFLHGWLFGVNGNLIRPKLRERLALYKRECYRVLAHAFAPKPQPVALLPTERIVDSIAAMADLIREHFDLDKPWGEVSARSHSMSLTEIVDVLDQAGLLPARQKRRYDRTDMRRRYYEVLTHEALMALGVKGGDFVRSHRFYLGIWPKGWA